MANLNKRLPARKSTNVRLPNRSASNSRLPARDATALRLPERDTTYRRLPARYSSALAPSATSNLTGWWDTYDATTLFSDAGVTQAGSTDAIYQINDKSGNSRNWVQATAARRPINTGTGITFDGTNHGMGGLQIGHLFAAGAKTMMLAFKVSDPYPARALFGDVVGYWNMQTDGTTNTLWRTINYGASELTVGVTAVTGTTLLYTYVHAGGAQYDQKNKNTATAPVTTADTGATAVAIYLGGLFGTSVMFAGTFYGGATWNVNLGSTNIPLVQQWFMERYGIT